jgi:DHA1 family inner membrane transport protein
LAFAAARSGAVYAHHPGQAIMTLAVPGSRRGAFMSLSGCARDLAMGITSSIGGWIVVKEPSGQLAHFHRLGWMAVFAGLVSVWLGSRVRVNEAVAPVLDPIKLSTAAATER